MSKILFSSTCGAHACMHGVRHEKQQPGEGAGFRDGMVGAHACMGQGTRNTQEALNHSRKGAGRGGRERDGENLEKSTRDHCVEFWPLGIVFVGEVHCIFHNMKGILLKKIFWGKTSDYRIVQRKR